MIENISLKNYTTFKIQASARYMIVATNTAQVLEAIAFANQKNLPLLVLGGGSNIVFTKDFEGLVLKIEIMGISITSDATNQENVVEVGAGQNWHELVLDTLSRGLFGLENLSLIPGTTGAAPIQNIGAYGVEAADTILWVEGIDLQNLTIRRYNADECLFGYRTSIFKTILKNKFIITKVAFGLSRIPNPRISYGAIADTLRAQNISNPNPIQISNAVILIRQSKLPDPNVLGNAGSFFKNPMILASEFEHLKIDYPTIVGFDAAQHGYIKVAAGWLIEQAGWKGYKTHTCGVYEKQALVLVNFGSATGQDIAGLADEIIKSVNSKFSIKLEPEVNMI